MNRRHGGRIAAASIPGANLNDFTLAHATIEGSPIERPAPTAESPQGLLDRGYDYPEVYEFAEEFAFTAHIRGRGEEAQAIKRRILVRCSPCSTSPAA